MKVINISDCCTFLLISSENHFASEEHVFI